MTDDGSLRLRTPGRERRAGRAATSREAWLASYLAALPSGRPDELVDADGRVRPHWEPLLVELEAEGPAGTERRFAVAERHLRESGVYYRIYENEDGERRGAGGSGVERAWPLSPVPLVIPAADWREIERGLIQRARLLEAVLQDVYGEARTVRDGLLPAAVVAGSPDYLGALAGAPRRGPLLHVYGADLGRGPDGRWWVLSDRTQAPSGMGFAVETRLALARAFPGLYRAMNVERLAPFFDAFRASLAARADREGSRIGLLSPGPLNETYFEHAYLARYLGLLLVEGGDLTVRDDRAFVRTVEGLKRIDVLLRRLDGHFADPLELDGSSRLGVPGLVGAVRARNVALANALGSGFAETRALLAFLPGLSRALLGEEPILPHVATWWLGNETLRAEFADRLFAGDGDDGRFSLATAFRRGAAGLDDGRALTLEEWGPQIRERLATPGGLDRHGPSLVVQQTPTLSTTPAWVDGRLCPRPFTLRAFAVSTPDGWRVMTGGFVRVAENDDPRCLSMQRGGRSADAWVASDAPVEPVTLLPRPEAVAIRRTLGYLPSRAADNLYWLGRYMERAETVVRLVRSLDARLLDEAEPRHDPNGAVVRLFRHGAAMGAFPAGFSQRGTDPAAALVAALLDPEAGASVAALTAGATRAAAAIRDRLAPDALRLLARLRALLRDASTDGDAEAGAVSEVADVALALAAAFAGVVGENMNRVSGWRFLMLGRRIERGVLVAGLCATLADEAASEGALDALLELTDSRQSYRARYLMGVQRPPVVDLVALDEGHPRSVAFQARDAEEHLSALIGEGAGGSLAAPLRTLLRLRTDLRTADPEELGVDGFRSVQARLMALSDEITARFFVQADAPEGEDALEPQPSPARLADGPERAGQSAGRARDA